ncbi:MAG TPA: hypothetical protein VJH67_02225 [Candidatus Paceibacterota bacterium]
MLYLIIGANKEGVDREIAKVAKGESILKIDSLSWEVDMVRGLIESSSLFGSDAEAIVFESVLENEEARNLMAGFALRMNGSSKKFFIVEGETEKEMIEVFEKVEAKIFDLREEKKNSWQKKGKEVAGYSPFALGDAVGKGSAKEAWIEYVKARGFGVGPEELHSRVWGKVRDMIASETALPEEIGIHPFVHKKAKADLRNWPKLKLQNFADSLVAIYHLARMGGEDLDVALEKTLLTI